ncbi:MAG: aminodeoxychorismate synthase component I [Deltaproteobacteria bacterium]|nr:aminodeoxychorismate synthase component I [Deltaproteobacteria bacterium]
MHTRELPLELAPWALFRVLARKERPFFIDAGRPWGSEWISSMGFGPRMQFQVRADAARAALPALADALAAIAPGRAAAARPRSVPFAGGAIVALAYETKNEIERLPQSQREDTGAPRLVAAIYDAVVAYDHHRGRYVAASWHLDAAALARYADEVMDAAAAAADDGTETSSAAHDADAGSGPSELTTSLDRDAYAARVERVRAYIAAGDLYQANLSMRLETPLVGSPLAIYGRLRAAQPVPFGAYLDLGDAHVLSNSPELFLRRRGERIETCPIKGTRHRGRDAATDARLADELRRDAKERAEHIMIVDLERSDLGRVCRTGSVHVERLAELATFRTLHHLVTTVRGTLPREVGIAELLRATFPGGSITGAPKIRAMEIIDELERGPRGFYTGALGWIDASGDLDLNVAIRTAVAARGRLVYSVGSGIVADSEAGREHDECRLKAEAFVRALDAESSPRGSIEAPPHDAGAAPARAEHASERRAS